MRIGMRRVVARRLGQRHSFIPWYSSSKCNSFIMRKCQPSLWQTGLSKLCKSKPWNNSTVSSLASTPKQRNTSAAVVSPVESADDSTDADAAKLIRKQKQKKNIALKFNISANHTTTHRKASSTALCGGFCGFCASTLAIGSSAAAQPTARSSPPSQSQSQS